MRSAGRSAWGRIATPGSAVGLATDYAMGPSKSIKEIMIILAHWIRISDILSWDRKYYLTHVILQRLSCEEWTLIVLELMHIIVKCRICYRKMTSLYKVPSQCIQELLGYFLKHKVQFLMVGRKKKTLFMWGWDIKFISLDHRLSSLVMLNGDPRDGFSYPTLTLMIDSYIIAHAYIYLQV